MGIRIWQGKGELEKSIVIVCPECGSEEVSLVHSQKMEFQVGGIEGHPVYEIHDPDTKCIFACNNPRCPKKPAHQFTKHFKVATRAEEF